MRSEDIFIFAYAILHLGGASEVTEFKIIGAKFDFGYTKLQFGDAIVSGERNTGTRYLQKLLSKNLRIPHLRLNVTDSRLNAMNEVQKDALYNRNQEFWYSVTLQ